MGPNPILVYRLSPQKRRPHFVQLYGLIQTNLSSFSRKFRRCVRAIIVLLHLGQVMTAIARSSRRQTRSVIYFSTSNSRDSEDEPYRVRPGSSACRQESGLERYPGYIKHNGKV